MTDWLVQHLSAPASVWAPNLTLVFMLFFRPWGQHSPLGSLSSLAGIVYGLWIATGLIVSPLAQVWWYWVGITAIHFLWVYSAYYIADNHHYLEGYWCLSIAIALAQGGPSTDESLRQSAVLLIGTCFLLAAVWKVASRSFRTGSFFVYSMLFDARFLAMAVWAGGLCEQVRKAHFTARAAAFKGASSSRADVPRRLRSLAVGLTWWTIIIEVAVGLAFLSPSATDAMRLATLTVFCVTTYVLVPVPAFGHILVLLLLVSVPSGLARLWLLIVSCVISVTPDLMVALYARARQTLMARVVTPEVRRMPSTASP